MTLICQTKFKGIFALRLVRMIHTKTKEQFLGRHLWVRSIYSILVRISFLFLAVDYFSISLLLRFLFIFCYQLVWCPCHGKWSARVVRNNTCHCRSSSKQWVSYILQRTACYLYDYCCSNLFMYSTDYLLVQIINRKTLPAFVMFMCCYHAN